MADTKKAKQVKVKFRVPVADGQGNRWVSGQVAEIDEDLAKAWTGLGFVEDPDKGFRTATRRAPRTTRGGGKKPKETEGSGDGKDGDDKPPAEGSGEGKDGDKKPPAEGSKED
jgi:hypothetical protein